MEIQFQDSPEKLKEVAQYFSNLSCREGVVPMVTRVRDPVYGSSGVHEAHRGIDFRNEYFDGKVNRWLLPQETMDEFVNSINKRYPRKDGKVVALYHSFDNGPYHMHLQIPFDWLTDEEKKKYE